MPQVQPGGQAAHRLSTFHRISFPHPRRSDVGNTPATDRDLQEFGCSPLGQRAPPMSAPPKAISEIRVIRSKPAILESKASSTWVYGTTTRHPPPFPPLLILAVPTPTAMAIMGWSSAAMATRYQHVLDCIRRDVANQVGGLLWDNSESEDEREDGGGQARDQAR